MEHYCTRRSQVLYRIFLYTVVSIITLLYIVVVAGKAIILKFAEFFKLTKTNFINNCYTFIFFYIIMYGKYCTIILAH